MVNVVRNVASEIKAEEKISTSTLAGGESEADKLGVSVPIEKRRSDESLTERPADSRAVTVLEKSSVDEITEKNNEGLKNVRLHWDLNLPIDAWGQPSDVEDEAPRRDEAVAENDKELQSCYDHSNSMLEDGELEERYHWEDYVGEEADEHVDYGSELEDDKCLSMVGSNDNKHEANERNDSKKHVVVNMSEPHTKGSSSSSSSRRSFGSKPFKVPSHDIIRRRRPDNYELSSGPARRDDRSRMCMPNMSPRRGYFSSSDSKSRFSVPNYNRGSFGFERARPKNMVDGRGGMMINSVQSGSGHGARPGKRGAKPDGHHVRRRHFSDGGDRDFKGLYGDTNNQFLDRMNNQMNATKRDRGSSNVSKRTNNHKSESRSRSYSPVSWNGRSRSSPAPPSGEFNRAEERFLADQDMSFMSPPRNRMSTTPKGDHESYNNSFWPERKSRLGQRLDVGSSMKRPDSDNISYDFIRPFIRNGRFVDAEENTGMNRFMRAQLQRTRRYEAMENGGGGDDIRRFRYGEQEVVVAADNNNKKNNVKES